MLFLAIVAFLLVTGSTITAFNLVKRTESDLSGVNADGRKKFLKNTGLTDWLMAVAVGFLVGFTLYTGLTSWMPAVGVAILYFMMLLLIVAAAIIWVRKCYGIDELICFVLLVLFITLVAWGVHGWCRGVFALAFFKWLPWVLFTAAVATFAIDMCREYRDRLNRKVERTDDDTKNLKAANILIWAIPAVFTLALLAMLIFGIGIKTWKTLDINLPKTAAVTRTAETAEPAETAKPAETPKPTATPAPAETAEAEEPVEPVSIGDGEFELSYDDWYWLYHWDVMGGDTADDDDFGKNPLDTILANKVARGELAVKDLAGKTEKELYALITFDEVFEEFMDELGFDPVKGAAVMGYYDVVFGTNFLGSSSTESMDHPDALMDLINEKAREWLKDQGAYYSALNSFIATLKRSDEAEIRYSDGGLDDQMYMWGETPDGVPRVIVMESVDHLGFVLTFRRYIKGTTKKEVNYRINCGFQPTNVGKVANVTVQPNPKNPPSTGGGGSSTGGGTPPSTGGGGQPSTGGGTSGGGYIPYIPPTYYSKDSSHSSASGKNDDPGIKNDPFTGTGVGGTKSSEDLPDNSDHGSVKEYEERIDWVADNRVAGDDNKPTADPPKPDTDVKDNAKDGTGNGGVDKGTPVNNGGTSGKDNDTGKPASGINDEISKRDDLWDGAAL